MKQADERVPFLDYFRGAAILSVFFFHSVWAVFPTELLPWTGWFRHFNLVPTDYPLFPANFGFVGVAIFFVVSGFCIHLSHQQSRYKNWKEFFLRRFFRIYPPYLLALLFFAFVFYPTRLDFGLRSQSFHAFVLSVKDFASHLLLIHNFSGKCYFGINASFWSIAVEVQLYLLYPALLGLARRWGWRRTLGITGLIELGLRGIEAILISVRPSVNLPLLVTASPFQYGFSWSMGAALADAYLKGESLPFRSKLGLLWPALFFFGYFFKPLYPFVFTFSALASAYLTASCLRRPTWKISFHKCGRYALEQVRRAGRVSYSVYLIHEPLLQAVPAMVARFFHHPPSTLVLYGFCLFSWFPIFGLSCLVHRYVERPSVALGKRLIGRDRRILAVERDLARN